MGNNDKDTGCRLTPEELDRMKRECVSELSRIRHKLLLEQPFIGNVALRFDLIPVRDRRCRTACTDYKNIYWDISFLQKLTKDERVFVMAHEVWHCIQIHSARRQTRDHELWNIAADMEINNILSDNSGGRALTAPDKLYFPPDSMRGQSAETLYDWLLKQAEKNNLNNALSKISEDRRSSQFGSGNGGSSDGKSGGNRKPKSGKLGPGEREKYDDSRDGVNSGTLEGQFDKHVYDDQSQDRDENGNEQVGPDGKENGKSGKGRGSVTDEWGEVGYDDDFRPRISNDAAERMREAVISAAQAYAREHGNLPAGVEGIVGKLCKPEISWRTMLSNFVASIPGGRHTWFPPNRRFVHSDMYFQSRRSEAIKVAVCIDTSGSCVSELPKFFGELKGLVESFGAYQLHVLECDAAVDRYRYFDQDDPIDLDTVSNIDYCGGGGTDYNPAFEYVDEHNLDIDCLIYFGDGFVGNVTVEKPPYSVMWLITKDGNMDFVDWGQKVRFKENSFE